MALHLRLTTRLLINPNVRQPMSQTWLVERLRSVLDNVDMGQLLLVQQFAHLFVIEIAVLPRTEEIKHLV